MSKIIGTVVIDTAKCKGCGLCVHACPTKTLGLSSNEVNHKGYAFAVVANDACIGCASCGLVCPDACISVYRTKI